ncbi:MAG: hypothetical protein IPK67_20985 [Planctomycetes bacterium]|nr:hypothetical protein [Planctomycetota bacterium]
MKHSALSATPWLLASLISGGLASGVRADCVTAWPSGTFNNDTWGASYINSSPTFAFEREVADDFDFSGRVTRIYVSGFNGGPTGSPTPIDGVWVRFYEWTPAGPGVLQAATSVAGNDPRVGVEPRPSGVEVELPTAFVASGLHFVSVQLDFTTYGSWDPWQCNFNAPRLSTGWVRQNNSSGTPWSLYTPPFGSTVHADVDFVLYGDSGPQCSEWSSSAVPTPGNDAGLVDVKVLAPDDVWALGNSSTQSGQSLNSYPFALHHDGASWSIVNLPPAPPLGNFGSRTTLEALEAAGPDDLWAAGSHVVVVPGGWVGHQIRADHWDGTAWTTAATPLPPTSTGAGYSGSRISGLKAFASNDVWFVGEWVGPYPGLQSLQPALAMHWDGSSFTLVPTPAAQPNAEQGLEAVDGVAPNDVWAVGGGGDGDLSSYPYILHWDGSSWSRVASPLVGFQQRLHDVIAFRTDDVWAVGEALDNSGYVGVLQHWDGSSWSNATPPPGSYPAAFDGASSSDLRLGLWH